MKKEMKGTILALLAAVVSGFSIPLNKLFVTGLEPATFTALRALIIGLIFLLLAMWQLRGAPKFLSSLSGKAMPLKKAPWKWLILIGLIGGGIAFLLFFTGLKLTTSGRAAFLQKTLPLFVTLLAFTFLREKIARKQAAALGVMMTGILLIFWTQIDAGAMWASPAVGDALIIIATLFWAVENVISRKVLREGETSFVVGFARMLFGAIFLFAAVALAGNFWAMFALTAQQAISVLASTGLLFLYMLFWYAAIKHVNVSKASTLLLIAPVVSLALGIIWFAEPAPLFQLAGSALILAGAYFVANVKSSLVTA